MYYKPMSTNEPTFPSCQELNNLFVIEDEISYENEKNEDVELPNISESRYFYSADVCNLDFQDEVNDFESFHIISLNIR